MLKPKGLLKPELVTHPVYAHTERWISSAFSAEYNLATSAKPKSAAVPAPRDVTIFPSSTTRSSRISGSSEATEKCAV